MLCGGSPGTPRLRVFISSQLLVGRCFNLSPTALPSSCRASNGSFSRIPLWIFLDRNLDVIPLGSALGWVVKVCVCIKISFLVSLNLLEQLGELGDIPFVNVDRLL